MHNVSLSGRAVQGVRELAFVVFMSAGLKFILQFEQRLASHLLAIFRESGPSIATCP
jgi:hypothetical protein